MTQPDGSASAPSPALPPLPPPSSSTTSLAEQLARSRLSGAPPAASQAGRSAFEESGIPPSTSPGVYFCEVRGKEGEREREREMD